MPGKWKSLLQADGTPIEYSWKWNTSQGRPEVRIAQEPIGPWAGTELDPLNQLATRELLHRLSQAIPSVNLEWSDHFFATLFDHDNAKLAAEGVAGADLSTSTGFGVDYSPGGPAIKAYFQGRKLGQKGFMPLDDWVSAIKPLLKQDPASGEGSLAALLQFIKSHPEVTPVNPFSLAIDCVPAAQSRMKLYMNTPHTSFASVRAIMTLGGRVGGEVVESQLRDLRELIRAVLGLPEDFSDDAETEQSYFKESLSAATASAPVQSNGNTTTSTNRHHANGAKSEQNGEHNTPPPHNPGFVYTFDVADGRPLPEVKLNIPLRSYGQDDLRAAQGLVGWMQARGRGAFTEGYMEMLEGLAPGSAVVENVLGRTRGLQSFLSVVFGRSGELGVTSYLAVRGSDAHKKFSPVGEVDDFHPAPRRGTRRRDDW
jgi:DMATS type aromatic prenyltransferase